MNNILFEGIIKYKKDKFDTKLIIDDKSVILKKKKLFSNNYKIIDSFDIKDIIIYKDKVKISNNKNNISIKTYIFTCDNSKDTKKVIDLLLSIRTGKTKIERISSKSIKTSKDVVKVIKAIKGIGSAALILAASINKNKKEFKKLYESIKNIKK